MVSATWSFNYALRYDDYRLPRLDVYASPHLLTLDLSHWRQSSVEVRVHDPKPPLVGAVAQFLLGRQAAILADYIDDHRREWCASEDEGDWAAVASFLRQWDKDNLRLG